ncbi:uncharacterized protein LOC128352078 [Hemicordylus capensis]|uniref:uncharacterized protein LOC128352078 n=1 Tax=Hemicordylus capensis TaxID=884348 RepID=UPI002304500C|nr:uncharacterized protein LOC128352078 [Hemicordylus capensis]
MPGKAKGKKGGRPVKQPKRPAPPQSSSEEEDEEMTLIRGLINRMEALEKAKAAPSDKGAGPSGVGGVPPPKVPRRTRGSVKSQLLTSLSSRLAALEEGLNPAGLGPSAPALPLPEPESPVPESPSPLLPPPAAPVVQPPVDTATPLAQGAGGAAVPVRVLMCGHSLVFWAFRRASTTRWGSQLGLGSKASVYWLGMRGMLWNQLLPALREHLDRFPIPDILVLHLGENDLGRRPGLAILQQASSDLSILRSWMPGVRIIWVNWLQRRVWRGAHSCLSLEKARRKISAAIGKVVLAAGGSVVRQPDIAARFPELFRPDGVHLSEKGCDLYLHNIREVLAEGLEGVGQEGQARANLPGWR